MFNAANCSRADVQSRRRHLYQCADGDDLFDDERRFDPLHHGRQHTQRDRGHALFQPAKHRRDDYAQSHRVQD